MLADSRFLDKASYSFLKSSPGRLSFNPTVCEERFSHLKHAALQWMPVCTVCGDPPVAWLGSGGWFALTISRLSVHKNTGSGFGWAVA